jgi:hypothetical protein
MRARFALGGAVGGLQAASMAAQEAFEQGRIRMKSVLPFALMAVLLSSWPSDAGARSTCPACPKGKICMCIATSLDGPGMSCSCHADPSPPKGTKGTWNPGSAYQPIREKPPISRPRPPSPTMAPRPSRR